MPVSGRILSKARLEFAQEGKTTRAPRFFIQRLEKAFLPAARGAIFGPWRTESPHVLHVWFIKGFSTFAGVLGRNCPLLGFSRA
jgi:hypothetical protein